MERIFGKYARSAIVCAVLLFTLLSTLLFLILVPFNGAPDDMKHFTVKKGESVKGVANRLHEEGFIDSPLIFELLVRGAFGGIVHHGEYFFDDGESLWYRAERITSDDPDARERKKIRIVEGSNIYQIAEAALEAYPDFDVEYFLTLAEKKEGYLYPDTYYFNSGNTVSPNELIYVMEKKFGEVTEKYKTTFEASNTSGFLETFEDVIVLASIVELEASKQIDRQEIAGVLLNRLEQDIPLQVDAVFRKINGKHTFTLSREDLKEEHPLNTYTNKGLPPEPIANPSVRSIYAVLNPIQHEYLYFLADKRGNTYYSHTHDEHVEKKQIYLR